MVIIFVSSLLEYKLGIVELPREYEPVDGIGRHLREAISFGCVSLIVGNLLRCEALQIILP